MNSHRGRWLLMKAVGALLLSLGALLTSIAFGQISPGSSPAPSGGTQAPGQPVASPGRPLPDVGVLMHAVEAHQRADEAALKNYTYRSDEMSEEKDDHGGIKKRTVRAYDVFWLHGVRVRKMISKDGRELRAAELKKEDERIDKEVEKARERRERNDEKGKQTSPRGDEEVTVSRILELGVFTNERRETVNERDTVVVDYAGDPKAKTKNHMEDVIRDLVGTVWVDEQDKTVIKLQGRFLNAFKIGGGLLVNIRKDTSFAMECRKVNGQVWLPVEIEGHGAARVMLFLNFDGSVRIQNSAFKKFTSSATMLPGFGKVEEAPRP